MAVSDKHGSRTLDSYSSYILGSLLDRTNAVLRLTFWRTKVLFTGLDPNIHLEEEKGKMGRENGKADR